MFRWIDVDDIFVIYVMWMMCYICEICVVEAGNINKNKKKALWTLCREPSSRQIFLFAESLVVGSRQTSFFLKTTSSANLFFNNSLPTVALGKEAVTPLAVVWSLLGRASLSRAIVYREP